jgi:hypothetical protein
MKQWLEPKFGPETPAEEAHSELAQLLARQHRSRKKNKVFSSEAADLAGVWRGAVNVV